MRRAGARAKSLFPFEVCSLSFPSWLYGAMVMIGDASVDADMQMTCKWKLPGCPGKGHVMRRTVKHSVQSTHGRYRENFRRPWGHLLPCDNRINQITLYACGHEFDVMTDYNPEQRHVLNDFNCSFKQIKPSSFAAPARYIWPQTREHPANRLWVYLA